MGHRHADLQRVGLSLMTRKNAVHVETGRRIGNVFTRGNRPGSSIDVARILQAVVKAAILMLVCELEELAECDLSASRYIPRCVVVAPVLRTRVAVVATSVGERPVPAHIEILHLAVSIA